MNDRDSIDRETLAITPGTESQSPGVCRRRLLPAVILSVVRSDREGKKRSISLETSVLDRDVVIALLKTDELAADSVPRLIREAQAMARLGSHPNIVTVYDIGDEDGQAFHRQPVCRSRVGRRSPKER